MLQENELRLFRENHKMEVKKLKDELDSVPKDQKKDAYRQLKEERDIQQAERVSQSIASLLLHFSSFASFALLLLLLFFSRCEDLLNFIKTRRH